MFYFGWVLKLMFINFFDIVWNMGFMSFELFCGVDCFNIVMFFDLIYFIGVKELVVYKNVVCIFE